MPISSTDIKVRLSGGGANANANLSLGGAESSVDAPAGLFDNATSAEALAGLNDYRCQYVRNAHSTLTAYQVKLWLSANTPSASTTISVGLGSAAVSAVEPTVANESTAPASVTFSAAADVGSALVIGDLAPGQTKAFWLRRTINAGSVSTGVAETYSVRVELDSAA